MIIFNDYICFAHKEMRPYGVVPVVNSLVVQWRVGGRLFRTSKQYVLRCRAAKGCLRDGCRVDHSSLLLFFMVLNGWGIVLTSGRLDQQRLNRLDIRTEDDLGYK